MATTGEPELPERVALNQSRFRDYNETIEPHNAAHHWVDPPQADWVCECAVEECTMPVRLSIAEYQAVREHPAKFLVAPGEQHVVPGVERVVERNERYWVVEKFGQAGEMSEALDRRVRDSGSAGDELRADAVAWNLPSARTGAEQVSTNEPTHVT